MTDILLNIADVRTRSRVNGPGLRAVVWVQGCSNRCPGCFNRHLQPHERRHLIDPTELGHRLAGIPGTNGITISGGEPFEQADACSKLASAIRDEGRSVMVFTGCRFEHLRGSSLPAIGRFLDAIDLLIAGPYVRERPADGADWRGSANQTVHILTDSLRGAVARHPRDGPVVEICTDGRALTQTGFPSDRDRQWLDRIAGTGVQMST